MADFPLAVLLQGDYGYKVVVVDDQDTMANVILKAREQLEGVLVKKVPKDTEFKIRVQGEEEMLPENLTVKAAKFKEFESVQILRVNSS